MARTGSALRLIIAAALLLAPALAGAAEPEFYMTVDRARVGTEDTFSVDIVVGNAPEGSTIAFPAANDFEVLSGDPFTDEADAEARLSDIEALDITGFQVQQTSDGKYRVLDPGPLSESDADDIADQLTSNGIPGTVSKIGSSSGGGGGGSTTSTTEADADS